MLFIGVSIVDLITKETEFEIQRFDEWIKWNRIEFDWFEGLQKIISIFTCEQKQLFFPRDVKYCIDSNQNCFVLKALSKGARWWILNQPYPLLSPERKPWHIKQTFFHERQNGSFCFVLHWSLFMVNFIEFQIKILLKYIFMSSRQGDHRNEPTAECSCFHIEI